MNWMRQKWCDWFHRSSWSGHVQFNIIEEKTSFEMRCSKCGRTWEKISSAG